MSQQSKLSTIEIQAIRSRVRGLRNPDGSKRHNPVKNPGAPARKAHAKLSARIGDFSRMMDDPANRNKDMSGFNKPGSMNRFA